MKRYASVYGAILVVAGCGVAAQQTATTTGPALASQTDQGRQVFESVCAECHTVQPPANKAPPMSHVARHYRQAITDRDEAVDRIAAWIRSPSEDRSLLPDHAIEMWGVMPPLQLPESRLEAVASYVWGLADEAGTGAGTMRGGEPMQERRMMRMGQGMMRGQGSAGEMAGHHHGMMAPDTMQHRMMGQHRHGMMHDTTATAPTDMMGAGMSCPMMRPDTMR